MYATIEANSRIITHTNIPEITNDIPPIEYRIPKTIRTIPIEILFPTLCAFTNFPVLGSVFVRFCNSFTVFSFFIIVKLSFWS